MIMLLVVVALYALSLLAPDWFFIHVFTPALVFRRLLVILGFTVVTVDWIFLAGATAGGIWDSLKARSWRVLLLWLMYVPVIAGFVFWNITNRGVWLSVFIAGGLLLAAHRYNARRRGLI